MQTNYQNKNSWRFLCLTLAFLAVLSSRGQIQLSPTRLDFGTTSPQTVWVRDIVVKNNGPKTDYLLRHTFSHEYSVLLSAKSILPDSSMVIRVQFKPREKANYNETVLLYFASMTEPVRIQVAAQVQYLNPEDHLACPDFSRLAKECCPKFMLMAEVVNATNEQPIAKAKIEFQPIDGDPLKLFTNTKGKVATEMHIHYYYIKVSADGYQSTLQETYINHRNSNLRFELQPSTTPLPVDKDTTTLVAQVTIPMDSSVLSSVFLPNNVVFLMDVSASMAKEEKLDLMKTSIQELTKVLRPQDKITLMVYAENAELLMATTSGQNKSEVYTAVAQLKASGNTNGATGFVAAYKMLQKTKIKKGNNQLYVITDGAFATVDQIQILKSVKRSKRKGIHTSIIGIRANIFAQQNLALVAREGNGQLIAIEQITDTRGIVADLKAHSLAE